MYLIFSLGPWYACLHEKKRLRVNPSHKWLFKIENLQHFNVGKQILASLDPHGISIRKFQLYRKMPNCYQRTMGTKGCARERDWVGRSGDNDEGEAHLL